MDKEIQILLAEDSTGDAFLIGEAFENADFANALHHVKDGTDAIEFLEQRGSYAKAPRPDLVILDLNMPRIGGYDVLNYIKQNDRFSTIPTVILTTSNSDEDIAKSYDEQANCFITKPTSIEGFAAMLERLEKFWVGTVTLPVTEDHQGAPV